MITNEKKKYRLKLRFKKKVNLQICILILIIYEANNKYYYLLIFPYIF